MSELKAALRTNLEDAVDELESYLGTVIPTDFQTPSSENEQNTDEIIRRIVWGIPQNGALTAKQSVDLLEELDLEENSLGDGSDSTVRPKVIIFGASDCLFNTFPSWEETDGFANLGEVVGIPLPEGDTASEPAHLSLFFVPSNVHGPSMRDTQGLSLFLNAIPTVQWSLSQPIIDIQIVSRRNYEPTADKKGAQAVSILRFLEGTAVINDDDPEYISLLGATGEGKADDLFRINSGSAGMEIFTAPQTMVPSPDRMPYDPAYNAAPIIDRFRPLMSLKDFTISTTGAGAGVISYRTAKANIVLHDRSRMTEISEILNHNTYSSTRFIVEWGWSHPHGQSVASDIDSTYGRFINSLRKREIYSLVKYSMSNDEAGQMNIGLDLASTAGKELEVIKISAAPGILGVPDMARQLYELTESISAAIGIIRGRGSLGGSNHAIRAFRVLGNAGNFQSMPNLDTKYGGTTFKVLLRSLKNRLRQVKRNSDDTALQEAADELLDDLDQFYKENSRDDPNSATLENFNQAIERAVNEKIRLCAGGGRRGQQSTADPFLRLTKNIGFGTRKTAWTSSNYGPANNMKMISFAKLMAVFIGTPLMGSSLYEDIQLIFHPFNDMAAKLGAKTDGSRPASNIGEFEIEAKMFKDALTRFLQARRSHEISVGEFVSFTISTFIDNKGASSYGMTDLFRMVEDDETHRIVMKRATRYKDLEHGAMTDEVTQRLLGMGVSSEFRMPQVTCVVETKARAVDNEGTGGNILKIHFIDKQASAGNRISNLLRFAYNKFIGSGEVAAPLQTTPTSEPIEQIEKMIRDYGAREVVADFNAQSGTSFQTLDEVAAAFDEDVSIFAEVVAGVATEATARMPTRIGLGAAYAAIRTFMPTVDFGSSMTAVSKLNISSEPDQLFATIGMVGGGATPGPLTPTGIGTGDLPLQVYPGRLNMTMMGCPILEYMQSIFVYLGTATSLDDVYNVVKVDHKLSPGTYETTVSAGYTDAYGTFRSHQRNLETLAARAKAVLAEGDESSE